MKQGREGNMLPADVENMRQRLKYLDQPISDAEIDALCDLALSTLNAGQHRDAIVEHVCGLQGYNTMIDPPCPGCEQRAALLQSTPAPAGSAVEEVQKYAAATELYTLALSLARRLDEAQHNAAAAVGLHEQAEKRAEELQRRLDATPARLGQWVPTEQQVARAATIIAQSPLIVSPKLPPVSWEGLARAILKAAAPDESWREG